MKWALSLVAATLVLLFATAQLIRMVRTHVRLTKELAGELSPVANVFQRYRILRMQRRNFASYLADRLKRLNSDEQWHDRRYTKLAHHRVETESGVRSWLGFRNESGIRRQRSLSRALRRSSDNFIVVEGEPGSGKSVSLRRTALHLLERAGKSFKVNAVLPLYVNLKNFHVEEPNVEDVAQYVIQSLLQGCTLEESRYLSTHFEAGLRNGTWLFLFDSFDEIPAVFAEADYEDTVQIYSNVLAEFLQRPDRNRCRGVVASRYFRGPRQTLWTRFRILPLSRSQQNGLLRRLGMMKGVRKQLLAQLTASQSVVAQLTDNPLFLSLLAQDVMASGVVRVPDTPYDLFDKHVKRQFALARDYIADNGYDEEALYEGASKLAFAIQQGALSLTPGRHDLSRGCAEMALLQEEAAERVVSAMEFIKLMRPEAGEVDAGGRPTTFVHRRFQEYFATRYLLNNPDAVPARELLASGHWRETAVTLLQLQEVPTQYTSALLAEATSIINGSWLAMVVQHGTSLAIPEPLEDFERARLRARFKSFAWAPLTRHVLDILDEGRGRKSGFIPEELRRQAGEILKYAAVRGARVDHKWAIELLGTTEEADKLWLVRSALLGESGWLQATAFRMSSRLESIPAELSRQIRTLLLMLASIGVLRKQRRSMAAQLSSLPGYGHWRSVLAALRWIPILQVFFFSVLALITVNAVSNGEADRWIIAVVGLTYAALLLVYPLVWRTGFTRTLGMAVDVGGAEVVVPWMYRSVIGIVAGSLYGSILMGALIAEMGVVWGNSLSGIIPLLYLLVWTIVLPQLVRVGRWLHPIFWPFQPLLAVLDVVRFAPRWTGSLWRLIGAHGYVRTVRFIAAVVLPLSLFMAGYLWSQLHHPQAASLVVGLLVIASGAMVWGVMTVQAIRVVRDMQWFSEWRRTVKSEEGTISRSHLERWIPEMRTERYALRWARSLRHLSKRPIDADGIEHLKLFLDLIEVRRSSDAHDGHGTLVRAWPPGLRGRIERFFRPVARDVMIPASVNDDFTQWVLRHYDGHLRELAHFGGPVADELAKVVEVRMSVP